MILDPIRRLFKGEERNIPDRYFIGHRNLAFSSNHANCAKNSCLSCRHAFRQERWHCDLHPLSCNWEPCYDEETISKADLRAGKDSWVRFPGLLTQGEKSTQSR